MPQRRLRFRTLVVSLSLAMCAATAALWLRSYAAWEGLVFWRMMSPPPPLPPPPLELPPPQLPPRLPSPPRPLRSSLYTPPRPRPPFRNAYLYHVGAGNGSLVILRARPFVLWSDGASGVRRYSRPAADFRVVVPASAWWQLGFAHEARGDDFVALVPLWFLVLPWTIAPAAAGLARLRRHRRARRGCCPACGYDLRATSGRCPECGTAARSLAPATD